jgi:aerobic-type carbon monoxide dehydrogenase small subunit (CoxS/CutS family)
LTAIQQAFIDHFAFQCGYCASGFVAAATVFIDRLKKQPIQRVNLESAIEEALNDHICRCTGYVRYYEAVRQVALETPGCVIG